MTTSEIQLLLQQALAHHQAGRLVDADVLYARVLAMEPENFDALHLAGFLALQQQRTAAGVTLLQRAHALNPAHAQCALRLAYGLKTLGRLAEARTAAALAATHDPQSADAHFCLGELAGKLEGFAAAVPYFRRVTALQPQASDGWANLGVALAQAQGHTEALACFETSLALDPNNPQALVGRALALQQTHRLAEAVAGYGRLLAKNPRHHEARSARLLALHYLDEVSRETLFAEHRAFGATFGAKVIREFSNPPQYHRRLRVGWISPDFRSHSVAHFIEPLLAQLDRAQFELFLYHDHATVDATSLRLRSSAAAWRHIAGQSDDAVEAVIRADAPDLLIDLAGHTGFNRLPLFARRLAPVQMTYLGYPDTTGLGAMDYRLTDERADPIADDADFFATEQLLRFSPCAWAYQPSLEAPEVSPPPSASGRPVTFGCFNNFSKVSDATLRGWAGVLEAVPDSRLLLKNHGLDDPALAASLEKRLAGLGLDPKRVELLGRTPGTAAHLALYARVDVALDTFPYHGTTTTCEALWQGRPVVTLAGDRHASRVGTSLLTAAGHPEWIALDWVEYADIAAGLAAAVDLRTQLARELREELGGSPLLDYAAQAGRMGAALRLAWKAWCAQAPAALCV